MSRDIERHVQKMKDDFEDLIYDIQAKVDELQSMIYDLQEFDMYEEEVSTVDDALTKLSIKLDDLEELATQGEPITDFELPMGSRYRPY